MPKLRGKEYIEVTEVINGQEVKVKKFIGTHGKTPASVPYVKSDKNSRFVNKYGKGGTFIK